MPYYELPSLEGLSKEFKEKKLLLEALTHRSYLNEHRECTTGQNERLEFLGDKVLGLIVANFLYTTMTGHPEGEMTEMFTRLTSNVALHRVGETLGLAKVLRMSKGQRQSLHEQSRDRQRMVACAFEALLGALFIDQGLQAVTEFLKKTILSPAQLHAAAIRDQDPKSALQEIAQEQKKVTPTYQVLDESGPDHDKRFVVGVFFGETLTATGQGPSKKLAEVEAAKAALNLQI